MFGSWKLLLTERGKPDWKNNALFNNWPIYALFCNEYNVKHFYYDTAGKPGKISFELNLNASKISVFVKWSTIYYYYTEYISGQRKYHRQFYYLNSYGFRRINLGSNYNWDEKVISVLILSLWVMGKNHQCISRRIFDYVTQTFNKKDIVKNIKD